MTKHEWRITKELRSPNDEWSGSVLPHSSFGLRYSSFFRHSTLVIRHFAAGRPNMAAIASTDALVSVGPYQLLEEIGRDSDIKFFKGCHRETGQLVAVKVVPPPYSADQVLVTRFEQEFRTSNALQHANIVRALDFGRVGSIVYLAAEFVEGTDLGTRIEHEGPLPEVEAVRIIVQAAQGLHHAHKHGIIHRNIKPANILLPTRGQAKLADLGLMKNLEADLDLTCRHIALGTPCYMAPEQLLDAKRAGV